MKIADEEHSQTGKNVRTASRDPFHIGNEIIKAGKSARFELPVARDLSGAWMSIPVTVVHGAKAGPVVWLSSTVHGDELNGIPIILRTLKALSAKELRGTVIAVPIVNAFGLIAGSRYLPDRRDLNRSFPGSKRGSLAAQMAYIFLEKIVKRCNFGIDFHTAAAGRTNLPQIRCNLKHEETNRLAHAFGAPITIDSSLRDGSLRAVASDLGIPVLLYEAGEANRFHRKSIEMGKQGALRVLKELNMIDRECSTPQTKVTNESKWIRAMRSGFCEISVKLGDEVKKGDVIATVFDGRGKSEHNIVSSVDGTVIGYSTTATVLRGDAVAHIAMTK